MRYFLLSITLLMGFVGHAESKARYTKSYRQAFSYITQLRFEEARKLVDDQRRMEPDNKVGDYLEAAMICSEIFANEDQEYFGSAQERIDELMESIEEVSRSNPFRNLFLGELYLAQATLNGKFKNNIRAAWQFYKAYDLLTDNAEKFPEFMPNKVPLGVLYAGIGSLPDDYRSLASLLGFEGSVQGGLAMIKEAFWRLSDDENLNFYRPYVGFVYSYITYQLGTGDDISPASLGLDVSNSSFLIFAQAKVDLHHGRAEQALHWLDNRPQGPKYFEFVYMDYLQARILLGLDPDRCVPYFQRYLENTHSQVYVKSTYRYLCWYYLLMGDRTKANEMQEQIFRKGNTTTGADRQAVDEAQRGFNTELIRARVLFDVGLYEQADDVLERTSIQLCCQSREDAVEYYYRRGRIKQETLNDEEAIRWFAKALKVEDAPSSFSLGNSALQLGMLYEQRGDKAQAKTFYKRTLDYSGYPFYEGVHQKAKAGLSRL